MTDTNADYRPSLPLSTCCAHCMGDAGRLAPVGPLVIRIQEPEEEEWDKTFCSWECLCDWMEIQAGRKPPLAV